MIIVPRMTNADELERACRRILYVPMEQRGVVADAIFAAVNHLLFRGAIDAQQAGRARQVAARHKMEVERWRQLKQKESSGATSDTTPSDNSGSGMGDLSSSTGRTPMVEPSTTPTSSNPIPTGPFSSSSPAPGQPSTRTTTSRAKGRSRKDGRGG